jgi:primosomal protein N' (replication factor Y)
LNEIDYLAYYEQEIAARNEVGYPPCTRLAELEMKHTHEDTIERESHTLATFLQDKATRAQLPVIVLGPAKPIVSTIAKTHLRKIYLKSESISALIELYRAIKKGNFISSIFFTPNP